MHGIADCPSSKLLRLPVLFRILCLELFPTNTTHIVKAPSLTVAKLLTLVRKSCPLCCLAFLFMHLESFNCISPLNSSGPRWYLDEPRPTSAQLGGSTTMQPSPAGKQEFMGYKSLFSFLWENENCNSQLRVAARLVLTEASYSGHVRNHLSYLLRLPVSLKSKREGITNQLWWAVCTARLIDALVPNRR